MKMNFKKQTSKGELSVEVSNGCASVSLNGQDRGTTGMLLTLPKPVVANGVAYVATICGFALTAPEAQELKVMLAHRDPTSPNSPTKDVVKGGIWSHCMTAEVNRAGDINKFNVR